MPSKDLNQIVKEIINEGRKKPGEWNALSSPSRFGNDMLIFHPEGPSYHLKLFEKNPYQIDGLGTKLSENVDNQFQKVVKKKKRTGDLGIINLDIRIIEESLDRGKSFDEILNSSIKGENDLGIELLKMGPSYHDKRPIPFQITDTDEQKQLKDDFRRLLVKEGKMNMYR